MPESLKEKVRDGILDFMGSTCRESTGLVSEAMDHRVSIVKRWKIRFHLALCEFCRHYREPLETIRELAKGLDKEAPEMEEQGSLKSDSKERMKQLLDENK